MAGFRSPLFVLGIAAAAAVTQGGNRSMLAPWMGGAGTPAAVEQGGCRSMVAFWMGGACSGPAQAETGGGGGRWRVIKSNTLDTLDFTLDEDEEILALAMCAMEVIEPCRH